MATRHTAGLAIGDGLLVVALLAVVNALRIVSLGLLGALAFRPVVFGTMASLAGVCAARERLSVVEKSERVEAT